MMFKIICLSFISFVSAQEDFRITSPACALNDNKCFGVLASEFLNLTCDGIPEYGIIRVDPLIIPSLDVENVDQGLVFHLENVVVTGMKNLQLTDYMMDKECNKSSVNLVANDLNIIGAIHIDFLDISKTLSGLYIASANSTGIITSNFSFVPYNKQDHYHIEGDLITCKIIGDPDISTSEDLQTALNNDSDIQCMEADYENALRSSVLRQVIVAAYSSVLQNVKLIFNLLPKSYIFKDV